MAALKWQFSGLIAGGYRTLGLSVRLLVGGIRTKRAVVGGLGTDKVTYYRSIKPGDAFTVRAEILDT